MATKKILYVCGSLNQTTMMHKISKALPEVDSYFTPFYVDGAYHFAHQRGWLDWTILGGQQKRLADNYLATHKLPIDHRGEGHKYDLVVTCTDLLIQKNLRHLPLVLVQEGMTDPENIAFHMVRALKGIGFPLWLASTSTTGLSDAYTKFCVASPGYRDHFIKKGVKEHKIEVTGIPNFDNTEEFLKNDFPYRDYVLVATSDTRENFKPDDRRRFLNWVKQIAGDNEILFKLHPNENVERSTREIKKHVPQAKVFADGNTPHMVANCHTLITQYSTVVYIGLALGKQVYSYFDLNELKRLLPIQNRGASAQNIAAVCRGLI